MNDTPNTNDAAKGNQPPRAKMWIFFLLFTIVAFAMYGGTMYRIKTDGFLGVGNDQIAHPEDYKKKPLQ
ncbi:hypothetical protein ACFL12_02480 [Pseudomonadota bacterium]